MARALSQGVIAVAVMVCTLLPMTHVDATPDTGWSPASMLETGNSGDAWYQQVAMDVSGNAHAIWSQFDGSRYGIWTNHFDPVGSWGVAESIETDHLGNGSQPKISMDGEGNAFAVWFSYQDLQYRIWSDRYVSGAGWVSAENIDPDHTDAMFPDVACDHAGNATAAWIRADSMGIWASNYTKGVGWGAPGRIDAGVGWPQPPTIGMDDRGNAIAVWGQSNWSQYSIWANRCVKGVGWGTAEMIESNSTEDASVPIVRVNGDGDAVVVWNQYTSGGPPSVWYNRYVVDVGWQEAELLAQGGTSENWNPRVAIDSHGNAVAIWYKVEGGQPHVWSNYYEAGTGWTGAIRLDTARIWAISCEVAMDVTGNATAVWQEYDATNSVVSSRYIRGLGWTTPVIVRSVSSAVEYPEVGAGPPGKAVVVWSELDGQYKSIYGASFQPPLIIVAEPPVGVLAVLLATTVTALLAVRKRFEVT